MKRSELKQLIKECVAESIDNQRKMDLIADEIHIKVRRIKKIASEKYGIK